MNTSDMVKRSKIIQMLQAAMQKRVANNVPASSATPEDVKNIKQALKPAPPDLKIVKDHLDKAQECNDMMAKVLGEESEEYRKKRDFHTAEGLKHLPESLEKAQYAKTAPVEERKQEKREKKTEERAKEAVGKFIEKKTKDMLASKTGSAPGKGIASETPKTTLRSPNKVDAGKQINPRK